MSARGTCAARAAIAAIALAGCGHSETKPESRPETKPETKPAPRSENRPDPPPAPSAPTPAPPAPAPAPAAASPIPAEARELITAVVDDWSATRAQLRRFRRASATAAWAPEGEPWPGVVGVSGTAWGIGLHGTGAPPDRAGPTKREGDGKSPAGAFALRGSYGYAAQPPAGTKLAYTRVDDRWKCVDDPASAHYDRILDRTTVRADWKSAESMRRSDELYRWVVDVAHNPARTAQAGSCIFLHVWRREDAGTVGCTAMPEPTLRQLIATLDPSAIFVLLPRAEYAALAAAWALPALP